MSLMPVVLSLPSLMMPKYSRMILNTSQRPAKRRRMLSAMELKNFMDDDVKYWPGRGRALPAVYWENLNIKKPFDEWLFSLSEFKNAVIP